LFSVGTGSAAATGAAPEIAPKVREYVRPPSSSASAKQRLTLCLALFAATLVFYSPVAQNGYVLLDDVPYILGNPQVRSGISWQTIKWSFTTFHAGYWHPVTWLSHALDCQLFGINPAGHHVVSVLIHAANAVLLFLVLQEATALVWPSWFVAALFALHPVNVESVAWAAERKNVLSMFFFLLAMWVHGKYVSKGGRWRYASVAACFAVGLMAKPQIITLPCVLLLWDYWPLNRMFPKASGNRESTPQRSFAFLVLEKIPLFLIAAAGSIITVLGQRSAEAVRSVSDYTLSGRIENAIVSYVRYLKNLFWPVHLTPLYPHPENTLRWWQVAGSVVVLLAITAAVLRWRERRYLAVGWLWFLGVLVPMIGIVQVGDQAMADRFEYIPMIGILLALVWGLNDLARDRNMSASLTAVPAILVLTILGGLTYHQAGYWKDGITLFRYTLSITKNQNDYLAHQALAMALDSAGRVEEAIPEFEAAEGMRAFPLPQVMNLAIYEQRNGHLTGAAKLFEKVTRIAKDPSIKASAWTQLGSVQVQLKNFNAAESAYQSALQINPEDPAALLGSGLLAEQRGDTSQAIALLRRSTNRDSNVVSLLLLEHALRRNQQLPDAQSVADQARSISSNFSHDEDSANRTEASFEVPVVSTAASH